MSISIHPRSEWGGPDSILKDPLTTEERCQQAIAATFDEQSLSPKFDGDIAYNFLICPHGNIYIGRGYERGEANHGQDDQGNPLKADGFWRNANYYSICGLLRGDQIANEDMVRAFRNLINHLRREATPQMTGTRIFPHKFEYETDCPGNLTMYAQRGSTIDPDYPWTGLADIYIYAAELWYNATYASIPGYVKCPEFGKTGWSTVLCLTQGLQHELGISPTVQNFGVTTFDAVTFRNKLPKNEDNTNLVRLYNATLWCKGYFASTDQSHWDDNAQSSLVKFYSDAGLSYSSMAQSMWPNVCRAMFRMDQFKQIPQGNNTTRHVQQWLNSHYVAGIGVPGMGLVPCDGWYSRDVQQGIMKALQYELGIPLASITGNFGPMTQAALKDKSTQTLTGSLRYLFRMTCFFNSPTYSASGAVPLDYLPSDMDTDTNTPTHVAWLQAFQSFSQLSITGTNDYRTWAQLLVSVGDSERPATGCDCITEITAARGTQLKAAGYQIIGRYLDEDLGPSDPHYLGKALKPGEPQTILNCGLRFFPIFQYSGRNLSNFTYASGLSQGQRAHDTALGYRIPAGTCIYFGVDYDALDDDIDSNIKPYFQGVRDGLSQRGSRYEFGVYGSRNICSRVSKEVGAKWSFVSGMSWGFSGNLGYPLPENWVFNQIKEFAFQGSFDLDNDIWRSGTDGGVSALSS